MRHVWSTWNMSFGLGSLERNPMLRLLLRGKTTQHTLRRFLDEAPSDIHVHGRVRAVRAGLVCWHVLGVPVVLWTADTIWIAGVRCRFELNGTAGQSGLARGGSTELT